jgi:protein-disulfide isomerase
MARSTQLVESSDHVRGRFDAPVTLIEYGDYECPYCGRAYFVVEDVLRRAGPSVRYVFRNFPLSQMHPHALVAAQWAEAAGAQGKFWEMHSTLFENQDALGTDDLLRYAQLLDLDVPRMVDEIREGVHLAKVKKDFRSGVRAGVNGTPTFFINGVRFDGDWATGLLDAIREAEAAGEGAPSHA